MITDISMFLGHSDGTSHIICFYFLLMIIKHDIKTFQWTDFICNFKVEAYICKDNSIFYEILCLKSQWLKFFSGIPKFFYIKHLEFHIYYVILYKIVFNQINLVLSIWVFNLESTLFNGKSGKTGYLFNEIMSSNM